MEGEGCYPTHCFACVAQFFDRQDYISALKEDWYLDVYS